MCSAEMRDRAATPVNRDVECRFGIVIPGSRSDGHIGEIMRTNGERKTEDLLRRKVEFSPTIASICFLVSAGSGVLGITPPEFLEWM